MNPERYRHCILARAREPDRQPLDDRLKPPAVYGLSNNTMIRTTLAPLSALLLACPDLSFGQDFLEPSKLPETVVTANRIAENEDSGPTVTLVDGESLAEMGLFSLQDALRDVPGVISLSTAGQRGQVGSLFIRGTQTAQAHLRVDGVRVSDRNVLSGNFLAQQVVSPLERVEILRGAQSALFGSESIGGVVSIGLERGTGEARTSVYGEAGSFNSWRGQTTSEGQAGAFSWALSLDTEGTDNDPAGNDVQEFERSGTALRLDYDLNDRVTIGTTIRYSRSELDSTLDSFSRDFGFLSTENGLFENEFLLATLFLDAELTDWWATNIRLGLHQEQFEGETVSVDTVGTRTGTTDTTLDSSKFSVEWQNAFTWHEHHTLVAGLLFERTDFEQAANLFFPGSGGFPDFVSNSITAQSENLWAVYANYIWTPSDTTEVSLGGRWEDFESFGDQLNGRVSVRQAFGDSGFAVRSSIGSAFRAPNFQELFGDGGNEPGNADLKPEESIGFEIGLEQKLGRRGGVSATYFRNDIENAIVDSFFAAPFNLEGSRESEGFEFLASVERPFDLPIALRVGWTRLFDEFQGLPQNVGSAQLTWRPAEGLALGAGLSYLGDRDFGGDPLEGYLVSRLFGSWQINEKVQLTARVENLFDEDFEQSRFDFDARRPGAGFGAFAGARVEF